MCTTAVGWLLALTFDVLYQAYLSVYLVLAAINALLNLDNPYLESKTQNEFNTPWASLTSPRRSPPWPARRSRQFGIRSGMCTCAITRSRVAASFISSAPGRATLFRDNFTQPC